MKPRVCPLRDDLTIAGSARRHLRLRRVHCSQHRLFSKDHVLLIIDNLFGRIEMKESYH